VVAPFDQGVGEVGDHGLDAAVGPGRDVEVGRDDHGDPELPGAGGKQAAQEFLLELRANHIVNVITPAATRRAPAWG
jgi:hypothetical protein